MELKKPDELRPYFFTSISHELRTPLTLMLNSIDHLIERNRLDDQDIDLLKVIEQNGRQVLQLTDAILDRSRPEAGPPEVQDKPVALYPFIRSLIARFDAYATHRGVRLVFHCHLPQYMQVWLDEEKFTLIFNSLVQHTFDHTPPGGVLSLHLEDFTRQFRLKIAGMEQDAPAEDRRHIPDLFHQAVPYRAPAQEDPEVRLVLCKALAGLLEGTLSTEINPGTACTFSFTFPKRMVLGVSEALVRPGPSRPHQENFSGPSPRQKAWLTELEVYVRKNLSDFAFNLETLSDHLAISSRQLRRRLKNLTGLCPREYILDIRLQEAQKLLEQEDPGSVKAVSLSVGLKDTKYFSRQFCKRFGRRPSSYLS